MTTDSVTREQCIEWLEFGIDNPDMRIRMDSAIAFRYFSAILAFLRPSAEPQATREPVCDECKGFGLVNIDDWRQAPCPSCTQASAVSERVSDERLAELIATVGSRVDVTHIKDYAAALRELQRLRHGSGELVECEEKHPNNRLLFKRLCAVAGIELGKDRIGEALDKVGKLARLSPEDGAGTHNQESVR